LDALPSSLTTLLLNKNKISSLSSLLHSNNSISKGKFGNNSLEKLRILEMKDNEFGREGMDELVLGLNCLEGLDEVDFSGNEVSEGKEFIFKVMHFKLLEEKSMEEKETRKKQRKN
jgi:hypothetical protein